MERMFPFERSKAITKFTCQIPDKALGVYNIEMNFGDAE